MSRIIWSTKFDGPDPNRVGKAVEKIMKEKPASTIMVDRPTPMQLFPARMVIEAANQFFSSTMQSMHPTFATMRELGMMCADRTTGYGVINGLITLVRKFALIEGGDEQRRERALKALDDAAAAIGQYKTSLETKPSYKQTMSGTIGYAIGLLLGEVGPQKQKSENP